MMKKKPCYFTFEHQEQCVGDAFAFVAHIPRGLSTIEQLFDALSKELQLPDYFGRNWNALWDCLGDLSWIQEKKVILFHQDVPNLERAALIFYLHLLNDSVADWHEGEEHQFTVIFPEATKETITELLLEGEDSERL